MAKCFCAARRKAAVIALTFGFLGPAATLAGAEAARPACPGLGYPGDEHRFRLFQHEAVVGDETFRIEEGADSLGALALSAEGSLDLGGRALSFNQKLRVDPETYALRSYDLEVTERSGVTQSIRAEQRADSVVLSIETHGTPFRRSYPSSGGTMVLDNLIANHLALLACRAARDGFRPETLSVFIPQVGALLPAVIVPLAPGVDGSRRIEIRMASVLEILTIDPVGRFSRLEIPSQALRYDRMLPAFDMPQGGGARQGAQQGDQGVPEGATPPAPAPETSRIPDSGAPVGRPIFTEEVVHFVSKGTKFDGILTLPSGGQPIPYASALLIPDFGPQDRDETIGPNHPFLDLARGLAVNGFATLRYDNRALAAPQTVDPRTVTIRDEVIDDALAALEFMRSRTEIDGARLFLVGHGNGASIAPAIALADGSLTGLVLVGGSLRLPDAILRDRLTREASMEDPASTLLRAQLDSLAAGTLPDERMIDGMPPRYYRAYASHDLAADLAAFHGPILVANPGKDIEVGPKDLDRWRDAVKTGGKKDVTIQEFPDLGHALIPVEGDPTPASLLVPGNVDPSLIEAIGAFMQSTPRRESRR